MTTAAAAATTPTTAMEQTVAGLCAADRSRGRNFCRLREHTHIRESVRDWRGGTVGASEPCRPTCVRPPSPFASWCPFRCWCCFLLLMLRLPVRWVYRRSYRFHPCWCFSRRRCTCCGFGMIVLEKGRSCATAAGRETNERRAHAGGLVRSRETDGEHQRKEPSPLLRRRR